MKFKIEDNKVVIADIALKATLSKHEHKYKNHEKITIYSIIKRFKERRGNHRPLGDNCPMLYAMKKAEGLTTDADTIDRLYEYAEKLIDAYPFDQHIDSSFDVIILMPSKHNIGQKLAYLLQQKFKIDVIENFLKKKSPHKLIEDVKNDKSIPHNVKQSLITALRRHHDSLSIKDIAPRDRHYLCIFSGDHVKLSPNAKHVLLVDDISSSGTTFESAATVVKAHCKQVEMISAFTLFAPIK